MVLSSSGVSFLGVERWVLALFNDGRCISLMLSIYSWLLTTKPLSPSMFGSGRLYFSEFETVIVIVIDLALI